MSGGSLQLIRRFRIPALFCALAVLACELISRPYAEMGICDDWPYILTAKTLSATGHIVYNGSTTPFLGWQLYLAAVFMKIFGYSLTTARMSTLLVAIALAFVLQRTLVRSNISERNATIGTLALVLSPLYLMLSVTFMTDIQGLFAIVICLYGCLRALAAVTSRATIGWLCFAVTTNAICGTSRQIAWLGLLVMVPSTLWLLRTRRRVFLAGATANSAGALFILGCMVWFQRQPYNVHEHLLVGTFPVLHTLSELLHAFLDGPFLLLPLMALFLPEIRKSSRRAIALISVGLSGYILLAIRWRHSHPGLLEPTLRAEGGRDWVTINGVYQGLTNGGPPIFLHTGVQVFLTIVSVGGLLGMLASYLRSRRTPPTPGGSSAISWRQLTVLLGPFTIVYGLLLVPRGATTGIFDRYLLPLLVVALLCLVRYYQEQIQLQLPFVSILLVGITAIYGVTFTHNTFSLYRARAAIADELRASGIPDTLVDNSWEYNFGVELQYAVFINDFRMALPADAYVPTHPLPAGTCPMFWYDDTPHIHPLYGVSFDPNACYGTAPFRAVTYSRWLASKPGTLYVVRYTAPSKL